MATAAVLVAASPGSSLIASNGPPSNDRYRNAAGHDRPPPLATPTAVGGPEPTCGAQLPRPLDLPEGYGGPQRVASSVPGQLIVKWTLGHRRNARTDSAYLAFAAEARIAEPGSVMFRPHSSWALPPVRACSACATFDLRRAEASRSTSWTPSLEGGRAPSGASQARAVHLHHAPGHSPPRSRSDGSRPDRSLQRPRFERRRDPEARRPGLPVGRPRTPLRPPAACRHLLDAD